MGYLLAGDKHVNELVELVGKSQPVVSKHLKVLRTAGLVTVIPDGQRRVYRLNPAPLKELDTWLEPYRAAWASRLDALEELLDNTHPSADDRAPNK